MTGPHRVGVVRIPDLSLEEPARAAVGFLAWPKTLATVNMFAGTYWHLRVNGPDATRRTVIYES
jgi:hypothetical protein